MRLKVPHHRQIDDGYCLPACVQMVLQVPEGGGVDELYCLPACVQMVLAYWGIERDQSSLAKQLGVIEGAGTPGSRLFLLVSPS